MDYVWELISPYVAALGGASGVGIIIYAILRLLFSKLLNKNNAMLSSTFNVDVLSQKVADKLAGKTLNIDITAVTEKALKKLAKELDEKIKKVEEATNAYKQILAEIGKAVSKLKALNKDEIEALASAIKAIEKDYIPRENDEPMTILLEPVVLENKKEQKETSTVNFGGLE